MHESKKQDALGISKFLTLTNLKELAKRMKVRSKMPWKIGNFLTVIIFKTKIGKRMTIKSTLLWNHVKFLTGGRLLH